MNDGYSLSSIPVFVRALSLMIGALLGWMMISRIVISRLDIVAMILAVILIISLKILGIDQVILCIILIDFLILTPTLRKLWLVPETEDPLAWIMA